MKQETLALIENTKAHVDNVPNRIATEKLLLARGYSWPTIKDYLDLTDNQYYSDRGKINEDINSNIVISSAIAFNDYRSIAEQAIEDLEDVLETADSTASAVSAIRGKEQIARSIIEVGQNVGIIPKTIDQKANLNLNFNINDKGELVDEIISRLKNGKS